MLLFPPRESNGGETTPFLSAFSPYINWSPLPSRTGAEFQKPPFTGWTRKTACRREACISRKKKAIVACCIGKQPIRAQNIHQS